MKKRIIFDLLALLAIAVGFFALLYFQDPNTDYFRQWKDTDIKTLVDEALVENGEYVKKQELKEDMPNKPDKQNFVQPSVEELKNCYYYSVLSDEEKIVYEEIYSSVKNREENTELSTLDAQVIEKIFKCVLNDHPRFYYVEGYTYMTYTWNEKIVKMEFVGTYSKTKEECEVLDAQIENAVVKCVSGMPAGISDYEKVKYIYEYIINTTEYDLNSVDNQNICSVFLNGKSVCMGYARAMQYLLLEQDILCTIVNGTAQQGQEHAWNMVLLEDQYYHLDVTWGDNSYMEINGETSQSGMPNFGFFCVPTEEISKTHQINSIVPLPQCVAWDCNYYIKEGLYFTDLDTDKLARVFADAYEKEYAYVEIKCADIVVYRKINTYLIEEQNIFKYLEDSKDTVSYYEGEDILLLEFWLK